jgi:hypothetical protein
MRTLCLLLVLLSSTASAHEHWLETEVSGKQLKVYLRLGDLFESSEPVLVRRRDRYTRFEVISPEATTDARAQLREDSSPLLVLEAPKACAIAGEASPIDIELTPQKFETYLFQERLYEVLAARAAAGNEEKPGRERYSRSLQRLLPGAPDTCALRSFGLTLEFQPATNPARAKAGSQLSFRVLLSGKPVANHPVLVANRHRSSIASQRLRTDADGKFAFTVDRPGDWMVATVRMVPSTEPGFDWRSYWGNLTFTLPE